MQRLPLAILTNKVFYKDFKHLINELSTLA